MTSKKEESSHQRVTALVEELNIMELLTSILIVSLRENRTWLQKALLIF